MINDLDKIKKYLQRVRKITNMYKTRTPITPEVSVVGDHLYMFDASRKEDVIDK